MRDQEERPSQRPTVVPPPGGGATRGGDPLPAEGAEIAGHRLVRLRGAGGQGVVYEAKERGTDRLVALKTLLPGATGEDVRRFEREIEVLARLDHPNIPPLFDSGVHAGRPWFTMRLVDGRTLVEHAEASGLGARGAVRLFLHACDAVAHAHGRGVIHRDLKPDNIRVDAAAEPQILDFGLAKSATAPTLTNVAAPMGTISHAAPEMLDGDLRKVDVRADVYSLGVILYRLIAGRLPIEMPESFAAALERVRHEEPERPSRLRAGLDADLDAIALKCLAKRPVERYATVLDLQRDLERWLHGDPVEARGRAAGYRLRKMLWRYRWPVAGAGAAVVALAGFTLTLSLQARALERERDRAVDEEHKARAMAEAFTDLVEDVDPERTDGLMHGEIASSQDTAASLVDRIGRRVQYKTDAEPRERVALLTAAGDAYLAIGIASRAVGQYGLALRAARALPDVRPDELLRLELAVNVGKGWSASEQEEADRGTAAVISQLRGMPGPSELLSLALHERADLLRRRHLPEQALPVAREALALRTESLGASVTTAKSKQLEAAILLDLGRPEEALRAIDAAAAMAEPLLWPGHPTLARVGHVRARALAALGRVDEAVDEVSFSFARLERSYGAEHPLVAAAARDAAEILSAAGRHDEAAQQLRNLLTLQRTMLGANDPATRDTLLALADELDATGAHDEADCKRAEAAIATHRLALGAP